MISHLLLLLCWPFASSASMGSKVRTSNRYSIRERALSASIMDDNQATCPTSSEISESLINAKLNESQLMKGGSKAGNQEYVDEHPELRGIVDQFVTSAIANRPTDVVEFAYKYFENLRNIRSATAVLPLVIAGPSGVGKGTLVNLLITRYPQLFGFSVSHTTRSPRPGEINGQHYHFVKLQEMEQAIARGDFLEYARVHTNMYGTSAKAVQDVQQSGRICILDIDIQGVKHVKKSTLACKYLFISPPSMALLEDRLRSRGTESEESIVVRLQAASEEVDFGSSEGNFDAVVVNSDLENAVAEIVAYLKQWYPGFDFSVKE